MLATIMLLKLIPPRSASPTCQTPSCCCFCSSSILIPVFVTDRMTYVQAYFQTASILPTGSLVDGALTPVNSPAATLSRRQLAAVDSLQPSSSVWTSATSADPPQHWQAAMQQPGTSHAKPSKDSMQEMDSLLAAEKVCCCLFLAQRLRPYSAAAPHRSSASNAAYLASSHA